MTMQAKVMQAIEAIVTKHKLEVVTAFSFSNVGTLHIQRPKELKTLFLISVNFQDDHMSAGIHGPEERKPVYGEFIYLRYQDQAGMGRFLAAIEQRVKGTK